jgi:hypothetical protein
MAISNLRQEFFIERPQDDRVLEQPRETQSCGIPNSGKQLLTRTDVRQRFLE